MSDTFEHPEALLAAWARGELSREGTLTLQEHARHCEACSAQLHALRDFPSELAPGELDAILNERAVQRALATLEARPTAQRKPWRVLALAFAALLVTGAVVAQWAAPFGGEPERPPPLENSLPPSASPVRGAPPPSQHAPFKEPPAHSAVPAPVPSVLSPKQGAVVAVTPAELFARGNELRRGGADVAALGVYADLQRRFPGSREALVSHAIVGRLLLERGRAAEAVAHFDEYLKRGDALAEDALVGRASALGRLGRGAEERRAWLELLRRFPHSVHAPRARSRVEQLQ